MRLEDVVKEYKNKMQQNMCDKSHIVYLVRYPETGELLLGENKDPVLFVGYGKESNKYKDVLNFIREGLRPGEMKRDIAACLSKLSICLVGVTYKRQIVNRPDIFFDLYMDNDMRWLTEQIEHALC